MNQLLENNEQFQKAAKSTLTASIDTESLTYRLGTKIAENPNVYTRIQDLFAVTSPRRQDRISKFTPHHLSTATEYTHHPELKTIIIMNKNQHVLVNDNQQTSKPHVGENLVACRFPTGG